MELLAELTKDHSSLAERDIELVTETLSEDTIRNIFRGSTVSVNKFISSISRVAKQYEAEICKFVIYIIDFISWIFL